jgi:RNA polymerase sigma-70 factor (ECF subfamily)
LSDLGYEEKDFEIKSPDLDPEASVHNTMQEEIIQNEIGKLSKKFKQVIILRDVQGLSYEEIAEIINAPLGTVKSRVNRARLKLQSELNKALGLK